MSSFSRLTGMTKPALGILFCAISSLVGTNSAVLTADGIIETVKAVEACLSGRVCIAVYFSDAGER